MKQYGSYSDNDYISREDAIKTIQQYGVGSYDFEDYTPEQAERFVIQRLSELPPVGKDTNVTTTDCVSREEVRELFTTCIAEKGKPYDFLYKLNNLSSVTPTTQWHRIKTRPLTEEEKDEMYLDDNYYTLMYDCKMPNDEQKVLVKTQWGIDVTTYYTDDGCYFEGYEDEGDVIAWMPLPEWKE